MLVLFAGPMLQACSSLPNWANPIEWYRDATGVSQHDSVGTERNTQNLEAGGREPYPNLGSVPPPPDTAMSTLDREKMQEGLVADRAHARYSNEALSTGENVPSLPGEAPPGSVVQAPPPAPPAAGSPSARTASAAPAARSSAAASAQATPPGQAAPRAQAPAKRILPPRGSEAPPQESSLTSPSVRSEPQGETPEAPPPPPTGTQPTQEAEVHVPPPPPPPSPVFNPVQPAPPPQTPPPSGRRQGPSITMAAAEIYFGAGSAEITPDNQQHLAEVARLYKQNGGTVRIVGFGRRGHGTEAAQQELSSFSQAIDRANAVAHALTKLGVPTNHIIVQAAPETATGGVEDERAEVLLEY